MLLKLMLLKLCAQADVAQALLLKLCAQADVAQADVPQADVNNQLADALDLTHKQASNGFTSKQRVQVEKSETHAAQDCKPECRFSH